MLVKDKPRVSVGMPVFNGEKYLKQALDSILAQTYQDFELVISDNASTDKTQQICLEYAKRDCRVSYYRSERNFGASWNHNRVFKLSLGKYFKWAAHDDVIAPEFLFKCVNVLEKDHSVVLCHSKTARIDEFGEVTGFYHYETITDSRKPQTRFSDALSRKGFPWMIFGVFRRDALSITPLLEGYIGSDWNLLAEISLIGRISEIPEYLFFRRDHPQAYTNWHWLKHAEVRNYRNETAWWTRRKRVLSFLPHWRNCLEFFRSVRHSPLKWSERWLCYEEISKWILKEGWRLLKWDLANEFKLWRIQLNSDHAKKDGVE